MKVKSLAAAAALAFATLAHATSHQGGAAAYTDAEVRKVDRAAGKVTLKHGAIPNLEMPPMTMVFTVPDAKMLDKVKQGDRVRFRAAEVKGTYTVVELLPVQAAAR
jgi:Cu/Ag efflux protein CusF